MYALDERTESSSWSPGTLMRAARQRVGLTESEIAIKIGTDRVTYRAFEANIVKPPSAVVDRIAHTLDIDPREIRNAYARLTE